MKDLFIIAIAALVLYEFTRPTPAPSAAASTGQTTPRAAAAADGAASSAISYGTGGVGLEPRAYQVPPNFQDEGSSWAAGAGNSFANWVDSIQIGGYPHITGVVKANEL